MSPLIFAILAGICWALMGLCYKLADHRRCRPIPFAVSFLLVAAAAAAFLLPGEKTTWNAPTLWLIAGAVGLVTFADIALLTRANALGPASIAWTMLNLGLLVPTLLAPVFFHESLHLVDGMLLALFLLMLVSFARSMATAGETRAEHALAFGLCVVGVFILEGLYLLGGKVKFHLYGDANSAGYTVITYLVGAVLAWGAHRFNRNYSPPSGTEWLVGALAGITSSAGSLLLLAAMKLPAIVVYPITMGIALLGGVTLTMVIFKERLNIYKTVGLVLGVIVLLMATLRDPLIAWFK